MLYVKGTLLDVDRWAVAFVGTRRASAYGRDMTYQLVTPLVNAGITIVSGLALGIDAAAHKAALDAGGRTIAVLGCGIDTIYPPEHRHLAAAIVDSGALVTQFAPGMPPDGEKLPGAEPDHQRLVAGRGRRRGAAKQRRAVDGGLRGGSGARRVRRAGERHVKGQRGGQPVDPERCQAGDLRRKISWRNSTSRAPPSRRSTQLREIAPSDPTEAALAGLLADEPAHIDDLCRASGLPITAGEQRAGHHGAEGAGAPPGRHDLHAGARSRGNLSPGLNCSERAGQSRALYSHRGNSRRKAYGPLLRVDPGGRRRHAPVAAEPQDAPQANAAAGRRAHDVRDLGRAAAAAAAPGADVRRDRARPGGRAARSARRKCPSENFIVEPFGQDTGPAVGLGTMHIQRRDPDAIIAMLTADQHIADKERFRRVLAAAAELAGQGHIVTLGISPSFPSTGFGYIKRGEPLAEIGGFQAYHAAGFTEKPNADMAIQFMATGLYSWNSGMFIYKADQVLAELRTPAAGYVRPRAGDRGCRLAATITRRCSTKSGRRCTKLSIDYAVMEGAERVVVIPVDIGWSDIGSWATLLEVLAGDLNGNVSRGHAAGAPEDRHARNADRQRPDGGDHRDRGHRDRGYGRRAAGVPPRPVAGRARGGHPASQTRATPRTCKGAERWLFSPRRSICTCRACPR